MFNKNLFFVKQTYIFVLSKKGHLQNAKKILKSTIKSFHIKSFD
jgi:hypothetical protein